MAKSLKDRFWILAKARTADFGFTVHCETMLLDFIRYGTQTLSSEGFAENKIKMQEAEANLHRFLDAMIREATRRGLSNLQESTFHAARISLRPLWPFC
jgi:hypothetical protein